MEDQEKLNLRIARLEHRVRDLEQALEDERAFTRDIEEAVNRLSDHKV